MLNYQSLPGQDPELWQLIQAEQQRQAEELELIASENYTSPAVLEAMATVLANKYSEGYPSKRYYGGNQIIDQVEALCIERAKQLFSAEHVNVQPLSGSPANMAIYLALLKPGDTIMGLKLDHGGHLSHGHPVNFSGKLFNFVQYEVGADGYLNLEQLKQMALVEKPKMILAGYSAYSREIPWQAIQDIATAIGAITVADISHTAGLIAGQQLTNPVPIFDVVMTTTHKTLRGPRGAIIMCQAKYAKDIDKGVFPGLQGGPHEHIIAAKAVALAEALQPSFVDYAKQIITNAQAMAKEFVALGYTVLSGGTDTHLLVIDLQNKKLIGKTVETTLESIGVSISRSTVPNDPQPPYNPSGIRLGTPAITTRGFQAKDCVELAKIIDQAIINRDDSQQLNNLKQKVKGLCTQHPLPY
ncbi:MAG: serine hydroxymethyltransferase [bacterium]